MTNPAIKQDEQEPDIHSNLLWMVNEIVLAQQILGRRINDLRSRNQERTLVGTKLAAEQVSRIAEQLKACSDIIVRKSAEHLNRKPRV